MLCKQHEQGLCYNALINGVIITTVLEKSKYLLWKNVFSILVELHVSSDHMCFTILAYMALMTCMEMYCFLSHCMKITLHHGPSMT